MPLLQNMPKIRQNLSPSVISPGLQKIGRGIGQLAGEYAGRLKDIATLPGDIYRGKPVTQPEALGFTLSTLAGGAPGGARGLSSVGMTSRLGKARPSLATAELAGKSSWKALTRKMDDVRMKMAEYEGGSPALRYVRTRNPEYVRYKKQLDDLIFQKRDILRDYL